MTMTDLGAMLPQENSALLGISWLGSGVGRGLDSGVGGPGLRAFA